MSVITNLSGAPYFSDYDDAKQYYHVLFQPGVSVQVRELHEVQRIFQNQIEKFGDNILKSGTIIDGCNFSFFNYYPYCKISDQNTNGNATLPLSYEGLFVKNANNLTAYVTDAADGFETTAPDLKTLYLNYTNSGDSYNSTQFTAGDILTVFSGNNSLFSIGVTSGGIGFSNADEVIITAAISVNTSSGSFSNGEYLVNPTTGANVQIVGVAVNATTNSQILYIKPRLADLTNATANSTSWTLDLFDVVRNSTNTVTGSVNFIYGSGAKANIITNAAGKITDTVLTISGARYTLVPQVWVKSSNNSTGLASLNLVAKNYLTTVTIPSVSNAVGNGYAFAVSEGVIYQKGFFLKVDGQRVLVSKYDQMPNNVSVGFTTTESIITSNIDSSLLDNALGTENETAPGANRLKLVPSLVVQDTDIARANSEFLTLVEWNNGNPYKQNQETQYSVIEKEMAARTYDASGNFVLDPFQVTTASVANSTLEANTYSVIVDPGTAYIEGYKTKTYSNYVISVKKGTDTKLAPGQKISLNYGNYIRINQVAGIFQFSTGDTINLYDTATSYLANTAVVNSGVMTPAGTLIGTARIRSMVLESGIAGDPTAVYRLYLFAITTIAGANFKNTKGVYYNGTYKGIGDIVLQYDPTTAANICKLNQTNSGQGALAFHSGLESIKNSNNTTYTYRNLDQTTSTGNNGILTKSVAASPNEFFPYSGNLSSSQLSDLYVVPVGNNLIAYTSLTGNVTVNTTSASMVGNGTTFLNDLQSGDYVDIVNGGTNLIKKIVSVSNNTFATLDSNCSFSVAGLLYYRTFPKNIPVPFGSRSGLSGNVNSNSNILTLNFGVTFAGTVSVNTAIGYNVLLANTSSTSKTSNRNQMVKILASNNAGGLTGPWCLGVADAFRLRNVFVGNSSVNTSSSDITDQFYIDNNHLANYLDLSYLYLNPKSTLRLANTDYLLVQFDYFTSSGAGYYDTVSYLGTSNATQIAALDSLPLANLSSAASSWEVPEMNADNGDYYDMLNCLDFRPSAVNTVSTSTAANTAPLNPAYSLSFGNTADPANTKKFPLPDSLFTSDIEYYMGRKDAVIIPPDTNITVLNGNPSGDQTKRYEPDIPKNTFKLQIIDVPAYPNVTKNISANVVTVLNRNIYNERALLQRISEHTIRPILNANNVALNQPKAPTAADVAHLERRIKTLEYYQALSTLETSITNTVIPSSINGNINRFKYGFFADDFSTSIYSDRTNPQYFASIETANVAVTNVLLSNTLPQLASNVLTPGKFTFGLVHKLVDTSLSYSDFIIVDQTNATNPNPVCGTSPIVTSNTATVNAYFNYYFTPAAGRNGFPSLISRKIHLGSHSGSCKWYYFTLYDPFFTVYKNGNTYASSLTARAITPQEVAEFQSNPHAGKVFNGFAAAGYSLYNFQNNNGWVDYCGCIDLTHDATTGQEYTLEYHTIVPDYAFGWLFIGPEDAAKGTGMVIDACGGVPSTVYNGKMNIDVNGFSAKNDTQLRISCTGLKPNSTHYFFVSGTNLINTIKQVGKNFGDPLISNASGTIDLMFYYSAKNYGGNLGTLASLGQYEVEAIDGIANGEYETINIELKTVGSTASIDLVLVGSGPSAAIMNQVYKG